MQRDSPTVIGFSLSYPDANDKFHVTIQTCACSRFDALFVSSAPCLRLDWTRHVNEHALRFRRKPFGRGGLAYVKVRGGLTESALGEFYH